MVGGHIATTNKKRLLCAEKKAGLKFETVTSEIQATSQ
jgi:hypothetical protein